MPIVGKRGYERFYYKMPNKIKNLMSKGLLMDFKNNLDRIFKIEEHETAWSFYHHIGGTGGWYDAFKESCDKFGTDGVGLLRYYNKLPWYDSDIFDGEVVDYMIKLGVVEEGSYDEECSLAEEYYENDDDYVKVGTKHNGYTIIRWELKNWLKDNMSDNQYIIE